uniref:Uncharacterized protein n=1 Tax=Oryza rufipogon TaxID=4529 RepID=A0A0E0Q469_ORYRU
MARAAAATAAAIAPHLVPVIRGATPFAPAAATAAAISLHLVPVIRGATPFSSAVAAAAAAASTPARSSSALTQTLSFPIQAIRSAATSTPPWASSALTQPRYFSTRATRQENDIYLKQTVCSCMVVLAHQENMPFASLTKIKIGGWEEAYWKLNLRIDHLNAVMRDGQGMQVHREVLKVVSGGVCIFFIVVTIRHLKETFARRRAGLPSVISDGHKC